MATTHSTNDADYVAGNLSDAAMFITSVMRLIERVDGEAYCLLEMARKEITAAHDYLEKASSSDMPIDPEVAEMLRRVGSAY